MLRRWVLGIVRGCRRWASLGLALVAIVAIYERSAITAVVDRQVRCSLDEERIILGFLSAAFLDGIQLGEE